MWLSLRDIETSGGGLGREPHAVRHNIAALGFGGGHGNAGKEVPVLGLLIVGSAIGAEL